LTSADLTRRARQSDGSFIEYTIKGLLLPGGASNAGGISLPNIAKWAHTLYTSDVILEGDRILDADNILYDVHQCQAYFIADQFEYYMCELLVIDDYTLQSISFGAADTYTGWYAETYSDSTVYGCFSQRGQSRVQTPAGYYGRYDYVLVTADAVVEADRLQDVGGNTYKIELVQKVPSSRIDFAFNWYVAYLTLTGWATTPATSGTWHKDGDAIVSDVRYRWKYYFQSYITAANIKKDNAVTNASTHFMIEREGYPIAELLLYGGKNLDAVATIHLSQSTPLLGYNSSSMKIDKIYAYDETVEITLCAVDKSGVTAENVLEQFEEEIRHVVTDYSVGGADFFVGSLRSIKSGTTQHFNLGESTLCTRKVTLNYKRFNGEYGNSGVTIAYGVARASTYTLPNVVRISYPTLEVSDALLQIPSRIGDYTQVLGMGSMEIEVTCDLDVEDIDCTWKRPQDTTPKTDDVGFQVFLEILHNAALTWTYQTLNLNWGSFSVRLVKVQPSLQGDNLVTLTFREYNATSASDTYTSRWGIS